MVVRGNLFVLLLLLVLVVSSPAIGGSLKERGVSAVAGLLLVSGVALLSVQVEADNGKEVIWTAVANDSPAQFRSVFYLLEESFQELKNGRRIDPQDERLELVDAVGEVADDLEENFNIRVGKDFEIHRQVRNVVYLGNKEGESLFAGFLLDNRNYQKKRKRLSLYGIRGLEKEELSYRQIALFEDPDNHHGEVTVFAINDNFRVTSVYRPVRVAVYPADQVGKELAMVAYGADLGLWQRRCQVVERTGQEKRVVGLNNCWSSPNYYGLGAPIFDVEDNRLVGFRAGSWRDTWYAEGGSTEFITYVRRLQATTKVNPIDKVTTVWGKVKSLEFSD